MGKKVCLIPKSNASDSQVKIVKIYFKNEDYAKIGDLLFEFETSKATFEVFSETEGYINIKISEEQVCETGSEAIEFFENLDELIASKNLISKENDETFSKSNLVFSKKALKLLEENHVDFNLFILKHSNKSFITEEIVQAFITNRSMVYLPGSRKFNERDIVIFGAGGHALQCLEIINDSEYDFKGFVANKFDDEYLELILGTTIDDLTNMFNDGLKNIVIGFGLLDDLKKRTDIFHKLREIGFRTPNLISKSSSVSSLTNIPENIGVQIFQGAVIGPKVNLNENIVINSNATISHHCNINDGAFIAPGAILAGSVIIGKYALIGMGATLYMNVIIPEKKIIQNNSNII